MLYQPVIDDLKVSNSAGGMERCLVLQGNQYHIHPDPKPVSMEGGSSIVFSRPYFQVSDFRKSWRFTHLKNIHPVCEFCNDLKLASPSLVY